jgi:hypothetical protein
VGASERGDRAATFVAIAHPGIAVRLARQWTDCAAVAEAMAMFVGALAATAIAVEAGAAGAMGDEELGGAPGAGAMGRTRAQAAMGTDNRRGCRI